MVGNITKWSLPRQGIEIASPLCCSLNKISIKAFISEPVVRLCYLRRMDIKPLVAQHNKTLLSSQVPISSLIHDCE